MTSPTRAAEPPAQPQPPASSAARAWPQFHALHQPQEGRADLVFFKCPACGLVEVLDIATGLCRFCWRAAILSKGASE